jgi:hypothetical protein
MFRYTNIGQTKKKNIVLFDLYLKNESFIQQNE